MFTESQYIIEKPIIVNRRTTLKSRISAGAGNTLGCIIRKNPFFAWSISKPFIWFEDINGIKQCEIRKEKGRRMIGKEIYGPQNDLRGKIRQSISMELFTNAAHTPYMTSQKIF
jgi:hypothetical protein